MHPIIGYKAKQAWIADLHRQAGRDHTARGMWHNMDVC